MDCEENSLEADIAEVEARLAVKPAEFQVEGSRDAKAEKETSLAALPENALSASSKNEMETRLTDKTDRQACKCSSGEYQR